MMDRNNSHFNPHGTFVSDNFILLVFYVFYGFAKIDQKISLRLNNTFNMWKIAFSKPRKQRSITLLFYF